MLLYCFTVSPVLGVSYRKVTFAFRNTFHANSTMFYSKQKEQHFLYIHKVYIVLYILVFSSFPGQALYTLGTEACHTCIAFAFYSWLAGRRHVIQADFTWWVHFSLVQFIVTHYRRPLQSTSNPHHRSTLREWHMMGVGSGLVQRASNGIIKAVQQGSVLMQRWRGGRGMWGAEVGVGCLGSEGGVGSGPGLQTDSWMGLGKV